MSCSVEMIKDQEVKHVTRHAVLRTINQPATRMIGRMKKQNFKVQLENQSTMEVIGLILIQQLVES